MSDDLEKMKQQRSALSERISEIEFAEADKASQEFVGKYYKNHDSRNDESWPAYWHIWASDGNFVHAHRFSSDPLGNYEFGRWHIVPGSHDLTEITEREYVEARSKFITDIIAADANPKVDE